MIPSLSGGIYKFDGDSIEAIPVTAEDLLKSSYKFTDDMVISGGKEVRTYGINSRTGKVIYECSMDGCKNQKNITEVLDESSEGAPSDDVLDDVLIVKRQTQTVRAIEPRTGGERWNFSIGHHELELLPSENCQSQGFKNDDIDNLILDLDLRVIVPEGIICGYSKQSPNTILWKQKFDSPIVSVFRMDTNNKLYSVDLFKNVNWLWKGQDFFKPSIDSKVSPSVYLGMYQQQLYIQESEFIKSTIDHHKQLEHNLISDENEFHKIPFKPFPASNTALVKLLEEDAPFEDNAVGEVRDSKEILKMDEKLNAQSVLYASQYANGKGFYFFTQNEYNHSLQCGKKTRSTNVNPAEFDNITFKHNGILGRSSSLWDYWKEISVIALTTAFVINVMLNNRRRPEAEVVYIPVNYAQEAVEFDEEVKKKRLEDELLLNEVQAKIRSASESNTVDETNYVSRFLTDFNLVRCLGRGGFGVVFEVKNKLDDCNYAIKRILLPSKKESRDRVMREVKTLANCEHKNIVRYFHAWVEQPPKGWQELNDKQLLTRDILSTSITIDSPSPTEESKAFVVQDEVSKFKRSFGHSNNSWLVNLQKKNLLEDFKKRRTASFDDSSSFIEFKADTNDLDELKDDEVNSESSESFDIEFKEPTRTSMSESFGIAFVEQTRNSASESSSNEQSHVISIRETEEESFSHSQVKGHRRQMSLDLPSISDAKLKKPNVVTGIATNKMYLYIQMQLCMKNSLKDWLQVNDLQTRNGKTFDIWNQIIEAVHYVHLKGLIHRDLKPSNIFFALDGQIKIGDFGLVTDMAEIPVDPLTGSSSSNSNSTANIGDFDFTSISQKKHTQRVGTSLYMSPEQSQGLPYNYKVDIFSLGLILFELLNFFHTETERFKVLDNIRRHIFPQDFIEKFKDEVSLPLPAIFFIVV